MWFHRILSNYVNEIMENQLSCNVERTLFRQFFISTTTLCRFRNRVKTKLARELGMMSSWDLLQWRPSCENVFVLFFFALIRVAKRNSKCENLNSPLRGRLEEWENWVTLATIWRINSALLGQLSIVCSSSKHNFEGEQWTKRSLIKSLRSFLGITFDHVPPSNWFIWKLIENIFIVARLFQLWHTQKPR